MVKPRPNNRAKGARRARRNSRKNVQRMNQTTRMGDGPKQGRPDPNTGTVVRTRFPRIGMSDLRNHTISWIAGYTFVGNGTNGAANAVLFKTAAGTYIMGNAGSGNLGGIPILPADSQVGATYVTDVEKHYARKIIKRMWMHVVSLQPSTSNNMMAVVAPARGPGLAEQGIAEPLATATVVSQTLTNVMSMDGAMTVDSFETKTIEITRFIAGGSGAKQNEFEMQYGANVANTVLVSGAAPDTDLIGLCPASFIVSGNNTTSGLQNTAVHAIVIEQQIDLLDYIGGSSLYQPVGVSSRATTSSSSTDDVLSAQDVVDVAKARALLERVRLSNAV